MQQNNELREFARAVARYKRGSNIPPLDVSEVEYEDRYENDDTRAKLARRAFRNITEQNQRKEEQRRFGFKVLMNVESIDHQWENEPWRFDPKHQDGAFLQIRCVPIAQYFLPLAKTAQYRPDSPYHISLCYTHDLHRFNLYDFMAGLTTGKTVYDRVRERYHGKIAHIRGEIRTGSVLVGRDTIVIARNGRRANHNLFDDEDVLALLAAGQYIRDDLHMTL